MRIILKSTITIVILCFICKNIGANTIYTSIKTETTVKGKQIDNLRKKVLASFKEDIRKQEAAKFLLENMDAHYSLESSRIITFQSHMDSIFTHYADRKNDFHKAAYDSASAKYGPFDVDFTKVYDTENVTAEYLTQQINEAFDAWDKPWNRDVSFSQFCHYVLPYRIGHEPLSPWRAEYAEKYRKSTERFRLSQSNRFFKNYIYSQLNQKFNAYIYTPNQFLPDFSLCSLLKMRIGNYDMNAMRNVAQLRAAGIPSTIDFVPQWGNRSMGHSWGVVFTGDNTFLPFGLNERLGDHFGFRPDHKLPKVYRHTFEKQAEMADIAKDATHVIPECFQNECIYDVTDLYTETSDVSINLYKDIDVEKYRWIYLAVFDNADWIPVAFAQAKDGKIVFPKMGRGIAYLPIVVSNDGEMIPAGDAFVLELSGVVRPLRADKKKEKVRLIRKYSLSQEQQEYCLGLNGGVFQVANSKDFNDSLTIGRIQGITESRYHSLSVNYKGEYKYFRYVGPKGNHGNMAEIQIYDTEGNRPKILPNKYGQKGDKDHGPEKMYDRNVLTSYILSGNETPWGAVEFDKPVNLKEIRFVPRNDGNFIYEGDNYELYYWEKEGWTLLSNIKGTRDGVLFVDNVPQGTLLLLHNATRGREERVFTYENGQQIWW